MEVNAIGRVWQKIQKIRGKEAVSIARMLGISFIVSVFLLPPLLLISPPLAWVIYFIIMLTNIAWLFSDIMNYEEQIADLKEKTKSN